MEFRLLGRLEVVGVDGAFGLDAHKPRALLALLLLHANEIVPTGRLIESLWDGTPPASATKLLQTYISQLRKELGAERIVTSAPGYVLSVAPGELDVEMFESARSSSPHEALALWRGTPLVDFEYDSWAQPEIARLTEARLGTIEERVDLDLARGHHHGLIVELEELVEEHPLRERLRGQLMLALYRSGRQAEALATYREGRRLLVDELGIEPSASLQQLERAILRQDEALDATPQSHAAEPERLIGRESVLGEIAELLESARLLTLTGPGGVGKTRVALEASARAAGRYANGSSLVELAALAEAELVGAEIARMLGVGEPSADALVAFLRGKELLLVLDNFEQVAAAAPLLDELLERAPSLSLLVTSRVPLRLTAETRYAVPSLELPDVRMLPSLDVLARTEAVALFVARARAIRPGFELLDENAAAVSELCSRLDGLPLAIELAGARADLLSPAAILTRLGRRLDLLRAADPAVPDRHRTLRATIEWSYDLLRPDERALFASLGAFSGGFSADGAEAVAGQDALDDLGALLDSSLVRSERPVADEPRLGMLETIREYALERLAERDDEDELRQRHAVFYCELAERAEPALRGPDQVAWLRRLDAERENLRTVLAWSGDGGPVELGLRTASALWRYWQIRAGLGEGRAYLERLLACDGEVSTRVRSEALAASGRLAFMYGDLGAAAVRLEESIELDNEGPLRAMSFAVLAMVAQARGDSVQAGKLIERCLAVAQETGDWFSHSLALTGRGEFLYVAGEFDAARRALEEGLRGAREVGDIRNIARGLSSLGAVALEQHEYGRATALLEESLAIQRQLDDRWGIPRSLAGLGVAALGRGGTDEAQMLFEQALALQLETDDRPGIAASLERIAVLSSQRGDDVGAASLYGAAAILREMVGTHPMQLVNHRGDEAIAAVAAALDPIVFADAWSHGRAMTLDAAVSYALDQMRRNDDVSHVFG